MKYLIISLTFCISFVNAQEFTRELPSKEMLQQLNSTNFPSSDAVIIVKEQSLKIEESEIYYRGLELSGLSRQTSNVKIVKLLNEAAVERYGSFEFAYPEPFGDEIPSGFSISARVMKESGTINIIAESDIHQIVSLKNKRNEPIQRKVIMKVSNLQAGDVLQIEYHHRQPFIVAVSGLFFYQDEDPVLFSNVYLTFPAKYEVDVYSYPEDKIGKPQIEDVSKTYGSGSTYFWSVRNCNGIPDEPYSIPFEDVSYLTGFAVKVPRGPDYRSWINLIMGYYDDYIDRDGLPGSFYKELGIPEKVENVTEGLIDTLYRLIKQNYRLNTVNEIYPEHDISDVVEDKFGDATDLSFIMYKVLEEWEQNANMVLIRDKRAGTIETSFPSLSWFSRAGVMVNINSHEKVYDFDEAAPINYEAPWFLNGVNLYVVNNSGGYFKKLSYPFTTEQHQVVESHKFVYNSGMEINDSLSLLYKGSFADRLRSQFYSADDEKIKSGLESGLLTGLSKIESSRYNNFYDNSSIKIDACGISSCAVEEVDSFIIIRPQEVVISKLKNSLLSSARTNHISFDSPFRYIVEFNIPVPEGYEITAIPNQASLTTTFNSVFSLKYDNFNDILNIKGTLRMPQNLIEAHNYPKLIEFIENSVKAVNRDLVFKMKQKAL